LPRPLAHAELTPLEALQDLGGDRAAQWPARGVDHLHVARAKVVRLPAQERQQLLDQNASGHVPVGPELDRAHLGVKQWGPGIHRLAHHHLHPARRQARPAGGVEREQREGGDVHHQEAPASERRQPAKPLQGEFDLPDPAAERGVQGGQRGFAQNAVAHQAVPELKPAHRGGLGVPVDHGGIRGVVAQVSDGP
jgi:hypothetical protein